MLKQVEWQLESSVGSWNKELIHSDHLKYSCLSIRSLIEQEIKKCIRYCSKATFIQRRVTLPNQIYFPENERYFFVLVIFLHLDSVESQEISS